MQYARIVAIGVVFGVASFTSCTCQKRVVAPPTFEAPRSGFHAASGTASPSPQLRVQLPTPSPMRREEPPQEVAEAEATPTMPVEIPEDFPADVPIFKDAAVAQVQNLANDARNVLFVTAAPVEEVARFYHEKMRQAGWETTQEIAREKHAFATFKKGNLIANLTIAEDADNPGKQVIAIMYEEEQPLEFEDF